MPDRRAALLAELETARGAFLAALDDVDADLVLVPGVVEDWSVRDLVVHLAAWAEHAALAIGLATSGRGDEFAYSTGDTDRMNAEHQAEAQRTAPRRALEREDAAFTAMRDAVSALDPELLPMRLGNGDSVEEVIRYDGPDHYAEHTAHLRSWFAPDEDDEQDEDVEA
jgi:hypothetical protein